MKNTPFGLDIGTTTMKAVWLTEEKDGFLLNAVAQSPTPVKGMLSESPLDQEEMAQAIQNLVQEANITTKLVNIAISENQVYTRVLEMPVLSDKELSSAIYWEAEQHIPLPLQSVTLDWSVLSRPKEEDGGKMQVLLVGAPIAIINKYQRMIEMAGLTIESVETEILSVIRATVIGENFPNTLIVHIGAVGTLFAIVKNGIVVFTYFVPIGGIAITRAISSDFAFSQPQAEEYKRTYGYSSKTLEGKIGKATEPILGSILTELKKAIAFYNEKYKNEAPITQVVLSGGSAKLPGIDLFFVKNCGIEIVLANPWKILKNQTVPKEILDNASDYTVSVGLAMKKV